MPEVNALKFHLELSSLEESIKKSQGETRLKLLSDLANVDATWSNSVLHIDDFGAASNAVLA